MKRRLSISQHGFTLIELLAVIVIIILLVSLMILGAQYANRKAAIELTGAEIKTLESALEAYKNDNGAYPTNLDINDLIQKKYITSWPRKNYNDPFGMPYNYRCVFSNGVWGGVSNRTSFDLWSYGPDRVGGTISNDLDNINNWSR